MGDISKQEEIRDKKYSGYRLKWVKMMEFKEKQPLYLLAEIAEILRAEGGCAWDREQTSKTLRPY
ncbi:MAG: hypothetical protein GY754_43520, partial [bacterium]|nr:hypothetical protein [bacterium]